MRPVRFNVAASLDGYIAGPNGEYDWIPNDPEVDFGALFAKVDTVLLGRRTWELVASSNVPRPWKKTTRLYVFSRTLRPEDVKGTTLVRDDAARAVAGLRAEEGDGEIWLFGGGELFGSLVAAGQVDRVEVALVPMLLGGGVPLLPAGTSRTALALRGTRTYPASGIVLMQYDVPGATT